MILRNTLGASTLLVCSPYIFCLLSNKGRFNDSMVASANFLMGSQMFYIRFTGSVLLAYWRNLGYEHCIVSLEFPWKHQMGFLSCNQPRRMTTLETPRVIIIF